MTMDQLIYLKTLIELGSINVIGTIRTEIYVDNFL